VCSKRPVHHGVRACDAPLPVGEPVRLGQSECWSRAPRDFFDGRGDGGCGGGRLGGIVPGRSGRAARAVRCRVGDHRLVGHLILWRDRSATYRPEPWTSRSTPATATSTRTMSRLFWNASSQTAPGDGMRISEIARVLAPGGTAYVTTVHKKWYGWYFYRCNGRWVIDPTHLREYRNDAELLRERAPAGLQVAENRKTQLFFPVADFFLRRLG